MLYIYNLKEPGILATLLLFIPTVLIDNYTTLIKNNTLHYRVSLGDYST